MKTDLVKISANQARPQLPLYRTRLGDANIQTELLQTASSLALTEPKKPGILIVSSYPPRQCGIATYSQDLIAAIEKKFGSGFNTQICALETGRETFRYDEKVKFVLNCHDPLSYLELAGQINEDVETSMVLVQHEFGFYAGNEKDFLCFLRGIKKPVVVVFHTITPRPVHLLQLNVYKIAYYCDALICMTEKSKQILVDDYGIRAEKINTIAHGTHLVANQSRRLLKEKYGLTNRRVLSTFGLISPVKSIETTLQALPAIVALNPNVIFLVIGKTHPGVVISQGEAYRESLEKLVETLHLQNHVKFINRYLELPVLLEYLRLTDIYLFTSKDPDQAVSGTFCYAMSCGCPIVSTPIPQAQEMVNHNSAVLFDFNQSDQLAGKVSSLLSNHRLRKELSTNAIHAIAPTAWENAAIAHGLLFETVMGRRHQLKYDLSDINLNHIKAMTNGFGMVQFAKINRPDLSSGYTLDDNARALIAMTMHYNLTNDRSDLPYLRTYLEYISFCLQKDGTYKNYVDKHKNFTEQNDTSNLDDSNGRAFWALGYFYSRKHTMPVEMAELAKELLVDSSILTYTVHSPRAMAFMIKGLYYYQRVHLTLSITNQIEDLADRLVALYDKESSPHWSWFEGYLTYANGVLPEALLLAWLVLKKDKYLEVALMSFEFLLTQTFSDHQIRVISNQKWFNKGGTRDHYGEQPIDISYTILALHTFYAIMRDHIYIEKMHTAFSWFSGNNHLHNIIYNPCTGGCYDGLEEKNVNLNQGAESTISYLMARLTIEKYAFASQMNKTY